MPGWIDSRQLLAGALHYFRVHPDLWEDRLLRLRAMGLNTVETYVAWNFHQPSPQAVDFSGWRDLARFIRLAASVGLDVILRPGPFICAEWDNGGLPAWLGFAGPMALRSSDPRYLAAVATWFDHLLPVLAPLQTTSGGPVIAMQVENEYGSYGTDGEYLRWLRDRMRGGGIDVPLFTADGPTDLMLQAGTLPDADVAVNFGSRAKEYLAFMADRYPAAPFFCAEYWASWFDHWGEEHQVRSAEDSVESLATLVNAGASVSIYMAHGGTNFGLCAGANFTQDRYRPIVTSYDSDAAIAEDGRLTQKFWAVRSLLESATGQVAPTPPPTPLAQRPQQQNPTAAMPLLELLESWSAAPVTSAVPLTMEQLSQSGGLVLYQATVPLPPGSSRLRLFDLADRAHVFLNGNLCGIVDRNHECAIDVVGAGDTVELAIVVENQGRVNFGPQLGEAKGLRGGVAVEGHQVARLVHGWTQRSIDLCQPLPQLPPVSQLPATGMFSAYFEVPQPADAYLSAPGWSKGFMWLNGFLLGRYWDRGPQQTLYSPAPLWHSGQNTVTVLELDRSGQMLSIEGAPELAETRGLSAL